MPTAQIKEGPPWTPSQHVFTAIGGPAAGSANTKSSYTEFVTSLSTDIDALMLTANYTSATNKDWLIDVAVGPDGVEVPIVSNLHLSSLLFWPMGAQTIIPISVAAGSRIAIRLQSNGPANWDMQRLALSGFRGGLWRSLSFESSETFGANTADSGGTSVDPGGSIGVKGSWVELSSGVPNLIEAITLCIGNQSNVVRAESYWLVDLGVGNTGAEVPILTDFQLGASNNVDIMCPALTFMPLTIYAGQRLAIRASCSISDATDRLFDAVVIGYSS